MHDSKCNPNWENRGRCFLRAGKMNVVGILPWILGRRLISAIYIRGLKLFWEGKLSDSFVLKAPKKSRKKVLLQSVAALVSVITPLIKGVPLVSRVNKEVSKLMS